MILNLKLWGRPRSCQRIFRGAGPGPAHRRGRPSAQGLAPLVWGNYERYIGNVTRRATGPPVRGTGARPARRLSYSILDLAAEAVLATIGVIAGDGIGPEVVREGLAVLAEAAARDGFRYETVAFDLGGERYLRTGEVLPDAVMDDLRRCDALLLGAVGHPGVPPGVLEKGVLLRLRFEFHQYVNLRPIRLYPGVETPIKGKGPDDIDMVVVRENNEDLYVGAGGFTRKGTPEEVAIQTSINTRAGVERCLRFAFDLARSRGQARPFRGLGEEDRARGRIGQVTMVAKTNVLTFAHDLWMRAFAEVARDYPDVKTDYQHVDACCMRMIVSPERFDVIATTNMFGDIITDLGAVLQGGMGLAASGNLNPARTAPSMFEPVHGSAPDIAGQGIANPIAACLSVAMMLDHLGAAATAGRVRGAVGRVLAAGAIKTPDLGGRSTTAEVGRADRRGRDGREIESATRIDPTLRGAGGPAHEPRLPWSCPGCQRPGAQHVLHGPPGHLGPQGVLPAVQGPGGGGHARRRPLPVVRLPELARGLRGAGVLQGARRRVHPHRAI
jgi:3-isopropylmalate dehydrogenase